MKRFLKMSAVVLAAALLASCSAVSSVRPERFIVVDAGLGAPYYLETATDIVLGTSERETAILDKMDLQLENDSLELYVGEYHDIAVRDKQTGKVFFSGEALYPEGGKKVNESTLQLAGSQLSLEYYDKDSMYHVKSSYPDCYLDDQIEQISMEKNGDSLRLVYTIGQKSDNYFFAPAMRTETFEKIKEMSGQLIADGKLRKVDYKNFLASYRIISVNVLSDSVLKEYVAKYTNLPTLQKIHTLKATISDNQKKNVSATFLAAGFTEEMIQAEAEALGSTEEYASEADYFEIPLVYTLQGRDLLVSIDTPNIISGESLHLTRVYLLNTFGASSRDEAGYLFLPDGSGTVIDNSTSVYGMSQMEVPFYGHDFGTTFKSFDTLEPHAALPVFGIKHEDAAVFAIVSGNDAMAGAVGRVSVANLDYCSAYPYFTYYTRDYLNQTNNIFTFSQVVPMQPFNVRYHFLYGEDADYSGMARYYRAWLEQAGLLVRQEAAAGDWKLDIRLIGSINKVVRTMGVPIKLVVATTTFTDGEAIIGKIADAGIDNLDIVYSEVMNGAKEYKAPGNIAIHRQLGGLRGYNDFLDRAESLGYQVFTYVDFGRIYKQGNGITGKNDVIQKLSRDTVMIFEGTTAPEGVAVPSLVNPARYASLVDRFNKACASVRTTGVYLPTLGFYLNGNYGEQTELTRHESQQLTVQALDQLRASGKTLKLDGGNAYVLAAADSLINVALDSSASRLEHYAVPFLGMVLKGSRDFSGTPVNNSGDYRKALLKTLENGAGLYFEIMAADPFVLSNTNYTNMYSVSSQTWLDEIITRYQEMNQSLSGLADQPIDDHRRLAADVYQTTYADGTRIIVNYSDQPYQAESTRIDSLDYAVLRP